MLNFLYRIISKKYREKCRQEKLELEEKKKFFYWGYSVHGVVWTDSNNKYEEVYIHYYENNLDQRKCEFEFKGSFVNSYKKQMKEDYSHIVRLWVDGRQVPPDWFNVRNPEKKDNVVQLVVDNSKDG